MNKEINQATWDLIHAQGRMVEKWSEGDDNVKNGLWKDLHDKGKKLRELMDQPSPISLDTHTAEDRSEDYWADFSHVNDKGERVISEANFKSAIRKCTTEYASLRENKAIQAQWIDVKNELPQVRFLPVLVFNGDAPEYNQCVTQACWCSQKNDFKLEFNDGKLMGTITHWMPLPKSPQLKKPSL